MIHEGFEEDRLDRSWAYERKHEDIFNVSFYTDHLSMTSEESFLIEYVVVDLFLIFM
jgi:hypothetical protein